MAQTAWTAQASNPTAWGDGGTTTTTTNYMLLLALTSDETTTSGGSSAPTAWATPTKTATAWSETDPVATAWGESSPTSTGWVNPTISFGIETSAGVTISTSAGEDILGTQGL